MKLKSFKNGWMMYSEYCRSRGIEQNGHNIRKLDGAPDSVKENVTGTGNRKSWAVDSVALDELWGLSECGHS